MFTSKTQQFLMLELHLYTRTTSCDHLQVLESSYI